MAVSAPDFLSPEVLTALTGGPRSTYGAECDWWSLGVIAYQMVYARLPFSDATSAKTISNILDYQANTFFITYLFIFEILDLR